MGYIIPSVKVAVLNFLSKKIFVESESEVLIRKLSLQNFEEDSSLYVTKNLCCSQK